MIVLGKNGINDHPFLKINFADNQPCLAEGSSHNHDRTHHQPAIMLVGWMLSDELAHPVGVCVEFTWSKNMINTINAIYSSLFIQSHYIIILILTGRPLAQQLPVVAGNCHDDHLRFEYNC